METLRTSSYMIPVRLEKEAGKYMLIHGYTGAVDIVSEELLAKIKSVSSGNNFSESTLQTLLKRGYVTTKTQAEEYAYVARMAKALHRKNDILNTSFTWVVTYNCNFRCPYCFEGRDKKDGKHRFVFTKEQVDIAYKAQDIIQPCKRLHTSVITLYGGEPLLAENKDIVNYIVEEGQKRGYTFKAITNGYEIDRFLNLLSPDGIHKLQITIDGTKETHDRRRKHYKGYETFDRIVENIGLALQRGIRIVVRMNSDEHNIEQFAELGNIFEQKGFFNYPEFYIYSARLRDYYDRISSETKDLSFIPPSSFTTKQIQFSSMAFRQDSGMYKKIYDALVNKHPMPFNSISCMAQSGGYVLDPIGNIYPCWEVVGQKENIKGVYSKEGVRWNNDVLNKWQNTDISQKEPCRHCKYALICGGGCPYHRQLKGRKSQCIIFKGSFDLIINKAYAELNKQY